MSDGSNATPLPDEVLADAQAFVRAVRWTATDALSPHEYLVRDRIGSGLVDDFDALVALIDGHGYKAWFMGFEYTYLELDDGWRYWRSRNLFGPGSNLNRARVDLAVEDQRQLPGMEATR